MAQGTLAGPAAQATVAKTAAEGVARSGSMLAGSGADLINGLPACRMGDTLQEATAVNSIATGVFRRQPLETE